MELGKQSLLDKLQAEKYREMRKNEVLAQEKIRDLNEAKFKLQEEEDKLLIDKGVFENMRKKGMDYLTEVELGNAPPISKVKQNMKVDKDEYRHARSKEEIMNLGKLILDHGSSKILRLQNELKDFKNENDLNDNWKEQVKVFFDNCETNAFNIAKAAMQEVLIKVFQGIDDSEQKLFDLKSRKGYLQAKNIRIDKTLEETKHRAAMKQLVSEFFEKKIALYAQETARESLYICKQVDNRVTEICIKAIKLEKNTPLSVEDMKVIAMNSTDTKITAARQVMLREFKEVKGAPVISFLLILIDN